MDGLILWPYQHFELAKAAIEPSTNLRSANTGISGVIRSDGNSVKGWLQ